MKSHKLFKDNQPSAVKRPAEQLREPDPPPPEVICPECGALMVLRTSKFGKFYGCSHYPECKGTHGAHPNGRPLGKPANQETKEARMRAHEVFDKLWKSGGGMNRTKAYAWMREVMRLKPDEAHIANFNKRQCEELIELVEWELKLKGKA